MSDNPVYTNIDGAWHRVEGETTDCGLHFTGDTPWTRVVPDGEKIHQPTDDKPKAKSARAS